MIKKNKQFISSLFLAGIFNLIQINIFNIDLTPDFILLTLIFWLFKTPNNISISTFWVVGLSTDVFMGDLMGQYALTYACCYFIAEYFMRRILINNKNQQLFYVFLIFLSAQIILLIINLIHNVRYPGLSYFFQSISAALIWHAFSKSKFFK
ncbi:MAG: rod shape-determining protein MreD [Candidatus Methylopumilus sp.]|nr:rod shape-determining protein MreD [Candidatus Methylopumilus sp.]